MIRLHHLDRLRTFTVACSLLGFGLLAGCDSGSSGGPPSVGKGNPGVNKIKEAKSKIEAGKK